MPQRGAALVHPSWVTACENANRLLPEDDFLLRGTFSSGPSASAKWSFDAGEARARAAAGPCLAGLTFMLSKHSKPPLDQLALIVESAGGKVASRLPPAPSGDEQTHYYAVLVLPADKVRARRCPRSVRRTAASAEPRPTHKCGLATIPLSPQPQDLAATLKKQGHSVIKPESLLLAVMQQDRSKLAA